MATEILVFYAGQLYEEHDSVSLRYGKVRWTAEIYNGAYVYVITSNHLSTYGWPGWYRCDGTPLRQEDVPKELLLLSLVMS